MVSPRHLWTRADHPCDQLLEDPPDGLLADPDVLLVFSDELLEGLLSPALLALPESLEPLDSFEPPLSLESFELLEPSLEDEELLPFLPEPSAARESLR